MTKGLYIHEHSKDMFIEVLSCETVSEGDRIRFRCWNKGIKGQAWLMTEKIFTGVLNADQKKNWRYYVVE